MKKSVSKKTSTHARARTKSTPKTTKTAIKVVLPSYEIKGLGVRDVRAASLAYPPPYKRPGLTANMAQKMADSFERTLEDVMTLIRTQCSTGNYSFCLFDRHGVTPKTKSKLRRMGYSVIDKNGVLSISWHPAPSVKDFNEAKQAVKSLLLRKMSKRK